VASASLLVLAAVAPGCVTGSDRSSARTSLTQIELRESNFETSDVHVVGEATRQYVFFIGVEGPPDTMSAAWERMREQAGIEGEAAQFVNVTEERTYRWMFLPFYYRKVYTVSADVIRFR
jgi:hypothetical protein